MAHYALLDTNNIVTSVITGVDENDTSTLPDGFASWEEWYGNYKGQTCKRTSINTNNNQHISGGTPFRGNYANVGYFYDEEQDVFYAQQPYPSWTLDSDLIWQPPIPYPDDTDGTVYEWIEPLYEHDNTQGWSVAGVEYTP